MAEQDEKMNRSDHDLLIRLDEKLGGFSASLATLSTDVREVYALIRGFSESIDAKITAAVQPKLDRHEFMEAKNNAEKLHDDHEKRIRRMEKYVWLALGALTILEIALSFVH